MCEKERKLRSCVVVVFVLIVYHSVHKLAHAGTYTDHSHIYTSHTHTMHTEIDRWMDHIGLLGLLGLLDAGPTKSRSATGVNEGGLFFLRGDCMRGLYEGTI